MEIKKVLEHTCFQLKGDGPMSPRKCRCRKFVTVEQAKTKVSLGLAEYVHVGDKIVVTEQDCTHCNEQYRRSCRECSGTGKITKREKTPVHGEDIIVTVTPDGLRNLTVKVKKSPTIEAKHILRGVENSDFGTRARERWDEYKMLTLKQRVRLLVTDQMSAYEFDNLWMLWTLDMEQPFPATLRSEPADDLKTHTGRRYDYGRSM